MQVWAVMTGTKSNPRVRSLWSTRIGATQEARKLDATYLRGARATVYAMEVKEAEES